MEMTREDGTLTTELGVVLAEGGAYLGLMPGGKGRGKRAPRQEEKRDSRAFEIRRQAARLGICGMRSFGAERRAHRDAPRMRVVRCP